MVYDATHPVISLHYIYIYIYRSQGVAGRKTQNSAFFYNIFKEGIRGVRGHRRSEKGKQKAALPADRSAAKRFSKIIKRWNPIPNSQTDGGQRLIQIADDVVRLLQTDAESDEALAELLRIEQNTLVVAGLRENQALVVAQ